MLPQLSVVFHQHRSFFLVLITFLSFAFFFFTFYLQQTVSQMLFIVSLAAPPILFLLFFLNPSKVGKCVFLAAVFGEKKTCTIFIVPFLATDVEKTCYKILLTCMQ